MTQDTYDFLRHLVAEIADDNHVEAEVDSESSHALTSSRTETPKKRRAKRTTGQESPKKIPSPKKPDCESTELTEGQETKSKMSISSLLE